MYPALAVILLLAFKISEGSECDTNGTTCIDFQNYQQCSNVSGEYVLVGNTTACPDGTVCDHSSGTAICKEISFDPAFFLSSQDVPQCSGPGNQSSSESCYQYYECTQVLFLWTPELKTCPHGLAFDIRTTSCIPQIHVQCQQRSTTTTLAPIEEPECKARGKFPALLCYQYFECVPMWWWYEPQLKTCPKGQAYDRSKRSCVCAGLVNCQLPGTKVSEVACDGPGNQAALTCREYYECTKLLWMWNPKLRKCPERQVYDKTTCSCVSEDLVECFGEVPKCEGHWKYPAVEKNQYYECVLNEAGNEWSSTLKTCSKGLVFVSKLGKCVPEWYLLFT